MQVATEEKVVRKCGRENSLNGDTPYMVMAWYRNGMEIVRFDIWIGGWLNANHEAWRIRPHFDKRAR